MTLTADDLAILKRPFPANDHEFIRGFVYITESAIMNRIDEVDPAASFELLETPRIRDNAGTNGTPRVIAVGKLTIKGAVRMNTGMADAQLTKDNVETGEPEKSATTDALKRCARLFGIGRYLLYVPRNVKDIQALARWLDATCPQGTSRDAHDSGEAKTTKTQEGAKSGQKQATPESWENSSWNKGLITELCEQFKGVYTPAQITGILGIERFSDWTQGAQAAFKTVQQHKQGQA